MPIFILNEEVQQSLAELRAYAEQHPFTRAEMEARQLVGSAFAPGDLADYTRIFLGGAKVVLTVEATRSGRQVRHLSVSLGGKLPYPFVVLDLMTHLGFWGDLNDCLVDLDTEPNCVSIIQLLTPEPVQ